VKTVIVIPAFGEADTIARVVRDASRHGTVVVVDDCSPDETAALAADAGADVVRLDRNRGYEGALEAGFARAAELGADAVATIDADGQHDASVFEALLAPLREGRAELVLGTRPRTARLAEFLFGLYARWRFRVPDILCGVKAYRIELYRRHGRFDGGRSVGTELALASLRRGARWATVPVAVRPRVAGTSRYGAALRANLKILRAMADAILLDLARGARQ
jgi:glycosyltransferase involved in cell wall biosynthesis